jgi:hypothetical protein
MIEATNAGNLQIDGSVISNTGSKHLKPRQGRYDDNGADRKKSAERVEDYGSLIGTPLKSFPSSASNASEVAQIGAALRSRATLWRRPPAHFSPPL